MGKAVSEIRHDIKNHLTSIKALAELLKKYVGDDKPKEYLERIDMQVNAITALVNEFSDKSEKR